MKKAIVLYDIVGYAEITYTIPDTWNGDDVLENHYRYDEAAFQPDSCEIYETDAVGEIEVRFK